MEKPAEERSLFSHFFLLSSVSAFERKNPWLYWTGFYFLFIIAAIFVTLFYVIICYPALGFSDTNVNSARYLLSSIIQAEAAIIAIVISLTLVAMQMVASSYSTRVIRIFSSGNQMYVILQFYIISIAYCAIILQMLQGETGPISPFHEYLVSFGLWCSIFLMIAIVPYIRNVLALLSPETIISLQCQTIEKDTIISGTSQSNPLDLIFDILHQSIMKYDTGLVKQQLPQVTQAVIGVLSGPRTDSEILEITLDYSQRLTACGQQSIQLDDLESSRIILENLKVLVNCTIALKKDEASKQVIDSISLLVKASVIKKSWNTITKIIDVLEECGKSAIENNLSVTTAWICVCLKQVTMDSVDAIPPDEDFGPFYLMAERSIEVISGFAHATITDDRTTITNMIIVYLEDIGKYCLTVKHEQFVHAITDKILDLWLYAVESRVECIRLPFAVYNAFHSRDLWLEQYRSESDRYECKVMQIGITACLQDMKNSMQGSAKVLAFFRLMDVTGYTENLNRFFRDLTDEGKRAAYRQVFDMSVELAGQGLENP